MRPKNNKLTLILSIIMTIICLPLAVLSTYGHILYPEKIEECDVTLVDGSCYVCENPTGYCGYAYNYVNDNKYSLNYYQGTNKYISSSPGFVFLMDTPTSFDKNNILVYPKVIAYNTTTKNKINLVGLNNYGIGLKDNYYIGIDDHGKYSIYYINQMVRRSFADTYDFIGVANHVENSKLDSSKFAVLANNEWKLIDASNNALSRTFQDAIYDYSDYALALHNAKDNNYYLADYAGNNILGMYFDRVTFYKNIILAINNNTMYIYDSASNSSLGSSLPMSSIDSYRVEENTDYLDLYIDDVATSRIYFDGHLGDITEQSLRDYSFFVQQFLRQ